MTLTNRKFITEGPGLPKWSNPISHAVVVNNMCFVSGQLSVNANGEFVPGDIKDEARLAFANVFAAIKASGFKPSDITYIDLAFIDLNQIDVVNEIYMELFPDNRRPARTVYQAAALPFGGKIKIVATAVKEIRP